ncbi:MAG: cysteine synthase family protein [Candidatus Krumholzibacteriia bacterium]
MIVDNILQAVGNTPVVRLNRVGDTLPAGTTLYGKCEFLNPGGSTKDRIAVRMVERLEREGVLKPGATIVEPTSGNTGIGLAMTAAVKGYQMVVTIAQKISEEKEIILEALGAEVHRSDDDSAPHTDPRSQYGKAAWLVEQRPGAVMPNQYKNPENAATHYASTAAEIWDDFGERLDAMVVGVGTGGSIMGMARYLRERNPRILIVGVEPVGSLLGGGSQTSPYHVEGIGYDWIPDIFDAKVADRFLSVHDRDSFRMARRLIREEGLLVGGSSGTVVHAMVEVARTLPPGSTVCGILADGIRNYLRKFPDDAWLARRDLL